MALRLYNTRTREVRPLEPLEPGHVRVYVCGLTPSAEAHLGHARSFLFFDVLRRYLEHPRNGWRVTYVQNVTDVDDRSIATARREGTTFDRVVARHYGAFKASMRALGVREPDREPYATAYVPQIVEMIGELLERGFAYVTDDGVYYAVERFPRYGALSGKNVDELLVGARIAENEHKRDPLDFALWKFSKPDEPSWASPWGTGRPGWHIECSAMSRALLGVPFDLHGGGYDLVFPHHENEIAQSEALMDRPPMAESWVHGGLLNFEGRKMSKSLGNFEPLTALLERHDPLAIRLLFLQTGYRKPMNFTEASIGAAKRALQRMQRGIARLVEQSAGTAMNAGEATAVLDAAGDANGVDAFESAFAALDDDMDTARAVGLLMGVVRTPIDASGGERVARLAAATLARARDLADVLGIGPALTDDAVRAALHVGTVPAAETSGAQTPAAGTATGAGSDLPPGAQRLFDDPGFVERLRAGLAGVVSLNGATPLQAVQTIIAAREKARRERDFALGDRLRRALLAEGIELHDTKGGTGWTVAAT
ncbi:MAG TPA: cysteine--tRNA ligase [Candidatus Baltobacteraceae bacterium]|nr:cysteine--tRNA ligase [Candidatus Baltobacteraceae bacterium]